jgi:hypothetical protein
MRRFGAAEAGYRRCVRGTQVGTSGWSYDHWRGVFYPPGVGSTRWLRYYAERFTSVEVNASFYRLPTERMLSRWVKDTPDHFAFVLKGSRLITHARRLDAAEALRTFIARSRTLGPKLHAMLWQLGPTFERDSRRLEQSQSGTRKSGTGALRKISAGRGVGVPPRAGSHRLPHIHAGGRRCRSPDPTSPRLTRCLTTLTRRQSPPASTLSVRFRKSGLRSKGRDGLRDDRGAR